MVVRGAPAIGITAAYGLALAELGGENMQVSSFTFRQGVPINMGIKRRIRNRRCKQLALCYQFSLIKIKLRLLDYILCKQ